MAKVMKKSVAFVLALIMAVAFMPMLPGGEASALSPDFIEVTPETTINVGTSDTKYYYIEAQNLYLKNLNNAIVIECIQTGGTPKVTQVDESKNQIGTEHDAWQTWKMEPIKVAIGSNVYFKITGGLGAKFIIHEYPWFANTDPQNPREILDNTEVKNFDFMRAEETASSYGNRYYTLTATEKAKYRIEASNVGVDVTEATDKKTTIEAGGKYDFILNKGKTLFIALKSNFKEGEVIIYRDIFNYMKTMQFEKTSYSVLAGKTATMKLNFTNLDSNKKNESTIVSKGLYNSDGDPVASVTQEDINTYTTSYDRPGVYTVKVKNSEGKTATTKLTIRPAKPIVSGYTATGTASSSKISIYDTHASGIDGFAVYLKSGSTYKYKGLTSYSNGYNTFNIKNLKANQTYYVKVKAYKKIGTEKAYSSYSDAMKIITAPSKKPYIKSSKALKTTYYKGTSTYHKGYWDAGGVWHKGYYIKTPAHSIASVQLYFASIKGATSYTSTYGALTKKRVGISVSGKAKAGKKRLRIRAVKKSGRAIAYGPWSSYKYVKIKAAR